SARKSSLRVSKKASRFRHSYFSAKKPICVILAARSSLMPMSLRPPVPGRFRASQPSAANSSPLSIRRKLSPCSRRSRSSFWRRPKPSRSSAREDAVKQLEAHLADPASFPILVTEAAHLDQRMRLGKILFEKALIVQVGLGDNPHQRNAAAIALAKSLAREQGIEFEKGAAEDLA